MTNSLITRYTIGNSHWPSTYSGTRDLVFEHQNRGAQIAHLASIQIESQKAAARDIVKSNMLGAQIIAAEMEQQTADLESAMSRIGNQVSNSITYAADQISYAVDALGDRLCISLDEIRWELAQQNQTLENILEVLQNSRSNETQQLLKQGLRHYVNAEYNDAEERFIKALEYDTTDYQLLMNLGYIEIHKDNSAAAHTYFKKALNLPENLDKASKSRTLWAIARLHYADSEYEPAFSIAEQALQLCNPDDFKGIFTTAVYAALSGKNTIALSKIQKTISLNPAMFGSAAIEPDLEVIRQDVNNLLSQIAHSAYTEATHLSEQVETEIQKVKTGKEVKQYSDLLEHLIQSKKKVDEILQQPTYQDCLKSIENLKMLHSIVLKFQSLDSLYSNKSAAESICNQKEKEFNEISEKYRNFEGFDPKVKPNGCGLGCGGLVVGAILTVVFQNAYGLDNSTGMAIFIVSMFSIIVIPYILYSLKKEKYEYIFSLYSKIGSEERNAADHLKQLKDRIVEIESTVFSISQPYYSTKNALKQLTVTLPGGVKLEMVSIPAGIFMMGSNDGNGDEKPVHRVTISKPFYMGKYEVTQAQWQAVMGKNPSNFKGANNPVESISWNDCQEFIKKVNALGKGTFRLPTEAEWEYACRAGTSTKYYWGDSTSQMGDYAWYDDNSGSSTHPVGQKRPNAWGLFDMSGNVWEWCQDWYDEGYYAKSPATDPANTVTDQYRVLRGGSWFNFDNWDFRSADRSGSTPGFTNGDLGFRLYRTP